MIKLYTLENLSAFSSDAIYKICLSLDRYGLTDDKVFTFENYDLLLDAAETSLAAGDYVIIAAENVDYSDLKRDVASRFMLSVSSEPSIAEAIAKNKGSIGENFDMEDHCTVPVGSKIHLSPDGLYSAFSFEMSNGICMLTPLDFDRLDSIIESFVKTYINRPATQKVTAVASQEKPANKFFEPVSNMVEALSASGKTISIATGEAAMNIYNLYDKIDGLSSAVNFVDVIDTKEEVLNVENPDFTGKIGDTDIGLEEDDFELFLADLDDEQVPTQKTSENEEASEEENEEAEEKETKPVNQEKQENQETETPSARAIRHAREAMDSMNADFGAAISDIYESQAEDGSVKYFAYVVVSDEKTTKTKILATSNKDDSALLLTHCVIVLSKLICRKIETEKQQTSEKTQSKPAEKFLSNRMIAFAAAVLVVAIVLPIMIVNLVLGGDSQNDPTALPDIVTGALNQLDLPITQMPSTEPSSTGPTTTNAFGLPGEYTTVPENGYAPAEPPASEVSAVATTQLVPSQSGTFIFYVFGYGHGAGLSQTGANYLASQGWNYAQILANYYYGTTLVSGDTYPETIKYNGQDYKTRDFLAGVLEAEMGGSYLPEALKAQCVAAYTFAKYYAFNLDTDKMAYKPTDSQVCYGAVDQIMKSGVYISYNDAPALTPFFATSAGKTTSYYNVWGQADLPYLQGGRPSYGDYNAKNFKQVKTYSSADLKSLIQSKDSSISLNGDPSTWISIISHDDAVNKDIGYVSSINVGGKIMSGNDFRSKIMGGDINSHCFMIEYKPD